MQLIRRGLFMVACLWLVMVSMAQGPVEKIYKVAVFAPIYLDSAFSNGNYKLGTANLPRQIIPGLDFYNGVMMAIDSLNKENAPVSVVFYDTKSVTTPLRTIIADPEWKDASLIIASFNTRNEVKPLADLALQLNIPLISSTYPNDGGISGNPFFVMLNPNLKTHIEAIYRFLHKTYPTENMILFRRSGGIEDVIQYILTDMNKKTAGTQLKIKMVDLTDSFSTSQVIEQLDSTRQNIVICGTLNEEFGMNLSKALGGVNTKKYRSITMGMPTWDGLRDISKDIEIIYTTPYNFIKNEKLSADLAAKYRARYAGRASDMFFKGYESMYHFTKLLVRNGGSLINALSAKDYKLFNDFDIQPVGSTQAGALPDYLENKKLYFIRKVDGQVKSIY